MAGYKLYVVGGAGGFMGADGVNPIDYILAVGTSDRMWFEVRDYRPRTQIGAVQVTVPAGPNDANALIDAVLAFDLGRFADCPSFADVRDQLQGVERLDFDRGLNIPTAWAKLREEARPIFARMGIWEADLREVRQSV
jgi:hypothetical protein